MSRDLELTDTQRSLYRRLTRGRAENAPAYSVLETRYLEASSGQDVDSAVVSGSGRAALKHLEHIVEEQWNPAFNAVLHADSLVCDTPYGRVLHLSAEMIKVFRQSGSISIDRLVRQLQEQHVLSAAPDDRRQDRVAQQLIFNLLGWNSLLYIPARALGTNSFRVHVESTHSDIKPSVTFEKANRPLDELLRALGDILPKKSRSSPPFEEASWNGGSHVSQKLQVSYLNVAALKTLAKAKIVWVDALSSHLEFDPTVPSLSLFRCPSFCKLQKSDDSILSILLQQFYEENEKPSRDYSVSKLMGEILLSYAVLFKHDRRARRQYVDHERSKAMIHTRTGRIIDPALDELCGKGITTSFFSMQSSVHDSYDAEADFPILKARLLRLHSFMEGVQPNRFMALWRDRRDLRLWYTIWVVIILGIIGLVETTLSLILTGIQVEYARKSYILQKMQTPPTTSTT